MSESPDRTLVYDVLRALRAITRCISDHSRTIGRVAGLTLPQLLALKAIGELSRIDAEVTTAQIAREIQLSPATMTGIIDRLQQRGLIVRERTSKDRRKICLALTDFGRQQLAQLPLPLQDQFIDRFMALTESERVQLLKSLERVVELMEGRLEDAAPVLMVDEPTAEPSM